MRFNIIKYFFQTVIQMKGILFVVMQSHCILQGLEQTLSRMGLRALADLIARDHAV